MSYTPISPFPTPPNRISDSPTEFSNKADAFLGQFPTFQVEVNDIAEWMNTTASTMLGYSDTAQAAAATAVARARVAELGAARPAVHVRDSARFLRRKLDSSEAGGARRNAGRSLCFPRTRSGYGSCASASSARPRHVFRRGRARPRLA